jgi:hypothetical protein
MIDGAALNAVAAAAPFVFALIFAGLAALFLWGGWPGRIVVLAVLAFLAGVPYSV